MSLEAKRHCDFCKYGVRKCKDCKLVRYCPSCQDQDLENHKKLCAQFQKAFRKVVALNRGPHQNLKLVEVLDIFKEFDIEQLKKSEFYWDAMTATHLNLGNFEEAARLTSYSEAVAFDLDEGGVNYSVYHVAVAALKWENLEKGHSSTFNAFKDTLESFGKGTLELQVATNDVIMSEIKKFVIVNELKEAKTECEKMIRLGDELFYYETYHEYKDSKNFMLKGFFDRIKKEGKKKMIIDYINFDPEEHNDPEKAKYKEDRLNVLFG